MNVRIGISLLALCAALPLAAGCGCERDRPLGVAVGSAPNGALGGQSDLEKVKNADYSILFVGNSHTSSQDLPNLVCEMIRFRHPQKTAYSYVVGVGFLEDTASSPECRKEIESRPWKFVVFQAQKISVSGKHDYSRADGIELAKLAKSRGSAVFFFCEWGLRGVPDNGPRHEKVYREMADASGAKVALVNRAWDAALAVRPDLPLYEADGNHQSATGAFLTAAFLCGKLTAESPAPLAAFPYPAVSAADRALLAEAAAKAFAEP